MAIKIDHIGIAVSNINESLKMYCDVLGMKPEEIKTETVADQKAKVAMIPIGESQIELLESTDPAGVIARFIEKRGEGIHHLAIRVKDISAELQNLKAKGIPLVDNEPRVGADGHKIAFVHPKAMKILMELVEVSH
ncbi:MAG: methylmalonyl-CoA epimerase [Chloroflexota bacterium]